MKRPNVVLIYTDQQRWDTLGAGGNALIHTPVLDGLAGQGALFKHCYVNCPVCMPSRQSMLSGLYPTVTGTTTNGIEMPEDIVTVQQILGLYGYHTANIGKLHFKNHSNRDHREVHPAYGFDHLELSDEPGCYDDAYIKWVEEHDPAQVDACRASTPPEWRGVPVVAEPRRTVDPYVFRGPEHLSHTAFVAEQTAEYIDQHAGEPFFCIAGIYAPHCPLNPPRRFVDLYDLDAMPLPQMNPGEDGYGLSEDAWRRVVGYYYALISHVDDQVGRILAAIDRNGLAEDTLVIFTSDHGEHLGDHGRTGKSLPYDSCSRVPLIMRYPGEIGAGTTHDQIVEHVDLVPTILDVCGIQTPPDMQGRSFRALLRGRDYVERSSAWIEHRVPFRNAYRAVRTHDYLYWARAGREPGAPGAVVRDELLFDMAKDPHQLTDVSGDPAYAEALSEMRAEMVRRLFDVESQYPLKTGEY